MPISGKFAASERKCHSGLRAVHAVAVASIGWSNGRTTPVATSQVRTANPPAANKARTPRATVCDPPRSLGPVAIARLQEGVSAIEWTEAQWRSAGYGHTPTEHRDDTDSLQLEGVDRAF